MWVISVKSAKMPSGRTIVNPSLREVLAESHIAAVAIAVLLVWSLEWLLDALWIPFFRVGEFVINAIAILGIPYDSHVFDFADRQTVFFSLFYCFLALTAIATAWTLSRWVYGIGPLKTLREYHKKFVRRSHA
jgi:hypothetical protein